MAITPDHQEALLVAGATRGSTPGKPVGRTQAIAHTSPEQTAHPRPSGHSAKVKRLISNTPHYPQRPSQAQFGVAQSEAVPEVSRAEWSGPGGREAEVGELIAAGMADSRNAACFLGERTVRNHIDCVFAQPHATSRSEAVAVRPGTVRRGTARHG